MINMETINPNKEIPRDATTNSGRHIAAISEYLRTRSSFHKGLEFIHIKDLAVHLVGHRIVWNQEVKTHLDALGFEVRILTISDRYDKPIRVLARPQTVPMPDSIKEVPHYPTYNTADTDLYHKLLNNLTYDGIILRTTIGELMFIRKDISNYLKYYKCPVVLRETFIKKLTKNSTKHRGVNRMLTTHYNPVWYYIVKDNIRW